MRTVSDLDRAHVPLLLAASVSGGVDLVAPANHDGLDIVDQRARVPVHQLHRREEIVRTDVVLRGTGQQVEQPVVPLLLARLQHRRARRE